MTDQTNQTEQSGDEGGDGKKLLKARPGRLELKKTVDAGQVRQSFSHGRTKSVAVEVRRKRTFTQGAGGGMQEVKKATAAAAEEALSQKAKPAAPAEQAEKGDSRRPAVLRTLTEEEAAARARALQDARAADQSGTNILNQVVEGAEARRAAAREDEQAREDEERRR